MTVISSAAYNYSPFLEPTNSNSLHYHNNNNVINTSNLLNQTSTTNFGDQARRHRQVSTDIASAEAAGCCLIKTLISNVLTFAT